MELVKEQTKANRYFLFELAWNAWPEIVRDVRMWCADCCEGHVCLRATSCEHQWVCQAGEEVDGLDDEQFVAC